MVALTLIQASAPESTVPRKEWGLIGLPFSREGIEATPSTAQQSMVQSSAKVEDNIDSRLLDPL